MVKVCPRELRSTTHDPYERPHFRTHKAARWPPHGGPCSTRWCAKRGRMDRGGCAKIRYQGGLRTTANGLIIRSSRQEVRDAASREWRLPMLAPEDVDAVTPMPTLLPTV